MDWSVIWPVFKDVLLGLFSLILSIATLRYGYLKFLKPYDAKAEEASAKNDRIDRNTVVRVLSRLLDEERANHNAHQERCDEELRKMGERLDKMRIESAQQLEAVRKESQDQLVKMQTEVEEATAAAAQAKGMCQEMDTQRDSLRAENNRLMIRVAKLHTEIVHLKRRIGDTSPTSDPEIDLSKG